MAPVRFTTCDARANPIPHSRRSPRRRNDQRPGGKLILCGFKSAIALSTGARNKLTWRFHSLSHSRSFRDRGFTASAQVVTFVPAASASSPLVRNRGTAGSPVTIDFTGSLMSSAGIC